MPAYTLRTAERGEFEALYAIHRAAMESHVAQTWGPWDDAWQRDMFRDHWPESRQAVLLDGALAGFLELEERPGQVWVGNIELAPQHHGKGIGGRMIRDIQANAATRGLGVGLQVLKVNPARRLYERLGFQQNGETETHYLMAWEATMTSNLAERKLVAFLDGEDSPTISNPIHSTEVAAKYGFRGALVGGVTVYGWLTPVILEVLGERWLTDGWADVRFRRPVFPGDELTARAQRGNGEMAEVSMLLEDGDGVIVGTAGLGQAPWSAELEMPSRRAAEPRPKEMPYLTLETAPRDVDLRPMPVPFSVEEATAYATNLQRDESGRFAGEGALVHPGWIAARMTPLLKHSYDYGPSIHTRTQVQHLASAKAGQEFTVAGHFIAAHEEKGHHVAVLDGVLLGEDGTELAKLRHSTIFRIREPKA